MAQAETAVATRHRLWCDTVLETQDPLVRWLRRVFLPPPRCNCGSPKIGDRG